ncbi:hypothetical protein, partial [Candidatus Magnetobacterium casense]
MIYIDGSELSKSSRLSKLLPELSTAWGYANVNAFAELAQVGNLEEWTGADIMLSPMKAPVNESLLKVHINKGAILAQLKFGRDLPSSLGTRLKESLWRMRGTGAKQHQCYLITIGQFGCNHEGLVVVDGQDERPRREYKAVIAALHHWNRAGVSLNISRDACLVTALKRLEEDILAPRESEFFPDVAAAEEFAGDDVLDAPAKVTDWRPQLAALPGIGPKMATALRNTMLEYG